MYRLIWETTEGIQTRTFPEWDDAKAHAATVSPEVDGSTIPQVSIDTDAMGDAYSAGVFWLGNRFAVIESLR